MLRGSSGRSLLIRAWMEASRFRQSAGTLFLSTSQSAGEGTNRLLASSLPKAMAGKSALQQEEVEASNAFRIDWTCPSTCELRVVDVNRQLLLFKLDSFLRLLHHKLILGGIRRSHLLGARSAGRSPVGRHGD